MKDWMNPELLPQLDRALKAPELRWTEMGWASDAEEEALWRRARAFALIADHLREAATDISMVVDDTCSAEVCEVFNDVPDLVALIVRRWWRAARQVRHLYPAGLQPEHLTFLIENDPTATDLPLPEDGHTPQPEE